MAGLWFTLGTLVFSTNKTDRHDITVILLKIVLNNINLILQSPICGVMVDMVALTDEVH